MKRTPILLAIVLILACASAHAAIFNFEAIMDGAQEAPPAVTPGSGYGRFIYDDVANTLQMDISFQDLITPAMAGHIHFAPPGVPGPIVFPFVNLPNATSGMFSETWVDLSTENQQRLFAGLLYANIHTPTFPAGEIRGQIVIIPELPASALAMIPGMCALIRYRKR